MIKTLARLGITVVLVVLAVILFKSDFEGSFKESYTSIIFNTKEDSDIFISSINDRFEDILHYDNVTLPINGIPVVKEMSFEDIHQFIDKNDYRNDPYVRSVEKLFTFSNEDSQVVYVKLKHSNLVNYLKLIHSLKVSGVEYKFGDPGFLRLLLNLISILLILVLWGYGCKTRIVISSLFFICAMLLLDLTSFYHFAGSLVIYFLLIMFAELLSLSNQYVRRDNIGYIRVIIFTVLLAMPTVLPNLLDFSYITKFIKPTEGSGLQYSDLKNSYKITGVNISSFYAHYAYQKSFLYGRKYLFPNDSESIMLEEFERVEHYLVSKDRKVMEFNKEFFDTFLSYCETTPLGKFYINYGRPFRLSDEPFTSGYIMKKEYMQISILAVMMLLSSIFFKKRRFR